MRSIAPEESAEQLPPNPAKILIFSAGAEGAKLSASGKIVRRSGCRDVDELYAFSNLLRAASAYVRLPNQFAEP
jgi:hypothetical protein